MSLIACYCRVSTRHQKNDSQRAEIARWLEQTSMDQSAIRWFEDRQLVALEGDGRFVAVYDYDAKGLHERVSLRHAPDRIARLVGDDRRAPDGNGR